MKGADGRGVTYQSQCGDLRLLVRNESACETNPYLEPAELFEDARRGTCSATWTRYCFFPVHQLRGKRFDGNNTAIDRFCFVASLRQTSFLLFLQRAVVSDSPPPLQMRPVATNYLQTFTDRPTTRAR